MPASPATSEEAANTKSPVKQPSLPPVIKALPTPVLSLSVSAYLLPRYKMGQSQCPLIPHLGHHFLTRPPDSLHPHWVSVLCSHNCRTSPQPHHCDCVFGGSLVSAFPCWTVHFIMAQAVWSHGFTCRIASPSLRLSQLLTHRATKRKVSYCCGGWKV